MSTPLEMRTYIEELQSGNPTEEVQALCAMLVKRLPKENNRGKPCPHCHFRMHNKCVVCPNCTRRVRASVKYRSKTGPPQPPPLQETDCNKCGNPVTSDARTLKCGHLFHAACLKDWVQLGNTHCFCKQTEIPLHFT